MAFCKNPLFVGILSYLCCKVRFVCYEPPIYNNKGKELVLPFVFGMKTFNIFIDYLDVAILYCPIVIS